MDVTFGWGFDGARWSADALAIGQVVTGPAGFTDLLATRLAVGMEIAPEPLRIAAYRAALVGLLAEGRADLVVWWADSFRADPWRVARELLAWRDELVAAGWDPPTDGSGSPVRLATLAEVKARLGTGVQGGPVLPPGRADVLHAVDRTLIELTSSPTGVVRRWPLGIDRVDVDHGLAALPPVWQRILRNIGTLGVEVHELPPPAPLEDLTVLSPDTDWDAAPPAARVLADWRARDCPHTVLAAHPTDLLDCELVRRSLPALGTRARSAQRPVGQVIPLFLAATTAPPDVNALADLLTTTVGVVEGDDATTCHPIRLLPAPLCRALMAALTEQPGVGGDAWTGAVEQVCADDHDATGTEGRIAPVARQFDRLVRLAPITPALSDVTGSASMLPVDQLVEHLDWLRTRLNTLGRASRGDALVDAAERTRMVTEILNGLGDRVTPRELGAIIEQCVGAGAPPPGAGPAADPLRDVVTAPGQLGLGTAPLLWWIPSDDTALPRTRCRREELDHLGSHGVDLPDRQAMASLELDSQLRAVRRRRQVVAILPAQVGGERTTPHPVLTFLLDDIRRATGAAGLDTAARSVTIPSAVPFADTGIPAAATWTLPGRTPVPLVRPQTREPHRPDPVGRRVTPGTQLLPEHLSFTQWSTLLIHPLEWLLQYPLRVRPSQLDTIPRGRQMIGRWMHRAVQEIVTAALEDSGGVPTVIRVTAGDTRGVLDHLRPSHASELDLPGRSRERAAVTDAGARSIAALFDALAAAGIRAAGSEVRFSEGSVLPVTRPTDGAPIRLDGARDLDVVLPDGRRGVVDLKYTRSVTKYRRLVSRGQALQLAVYAHSVVLERTVDPGGPPSRAQRLADVPVGYWSLRLGTMDTSFVEFGAADVHSVDPVDTGGTQADDLMRRATAGLTAVLDRLEHGRVVDLGNVVANEQLWKPLHQALVARKDLRAAAPPGVLTDDQLTVLQDTWDHTFLPIEDARYTHAARITGFQEDQL